MRGGGLCRQVTLKWDGIKAHQRSRRLKGENSEEANGVLKGV